MGASLPQNVETGNVRYVRRWVARLRDDARGYGTTLLWVRLYR